MLRFVPPLIITEQDIDQTVAVLDSVLEGNEKDLLSLYDLDTKDFDIIWRKAGKLKKYLKAGKVHDSLKGKRWE